MGACSSKPKTTEFEGSTEPSKETGAATADRSLESADADQVSQPNEPGKQEVGAVDINPEAPQQISEPSSSKDEEPVAKGLSSVEEGGPHGVEAKLDARDREAHSDGAESSNVDNGIVQKADEGVVAADGKEVSDKAPTVAEGVSGDQEKDFEDKGVVLDEAGVGRGDAYVDKGVTADDEKGQESGTAAAKGEQSVSESSGVTSPIIGVVQPVDKVRVDDISEKVDSATPETSAPVDSMERDISTETDTGYSSASKEGAHVLPDLHQESSEESREASHDDPKESPSVANISDDGVVQENGADVFRGKEELPASAYAQDTEDKTKPEKAEDSEGDFAERTIEPLDETSFKEGEKDHTEVPENEGNAEIADERQPQPEALNVIEAKDAESEHNTGTSLEKAIEQDDRAVEGPAVTETQPQALATDKPGENGEHETFVDEGAAKSTAESEHKVEKPHDEEVGVIEEKGEKVHADKHELPIGKERNGLGEGVTTFEDASDVPLNVEHSITEPGGRHSP